MTVLCRQSRWFMAAAMVAFGCLAAAAAQADWSGMALLCSPRWASLS